MGYVIRYSDGRWDIGGGWDTAHIERATRYASADLAHAVIEELLGAHAAQVVEVTDDALRKLDCGQDGVCAAARAVWRHWEMRCQELVEERDAARSALATARRLLNEARETLCGQYDSEDNAAMVRRIDAELGGSDAGR